MLVLAAASLSYLVLEGRSRLILSLVGHRSAASLTRRLVLPSVDTKDHY